MSNTVFPTIVQSIFDEFIPICKKLAGDRRYAISVGGSLGKGTWDEKSDIDFRLFTDRELVWASQRPDLWADYFAALEYWKQRGINIDGVWCRTVGEIDAEIDRYFSGDITRVDMVWTLWGYQVLTDVNNQYIIEDPFGIIRGWKERLRSYPPAMKKAILEKHLESLRYWRADYHYAHKVERGDVVFVAAITSRLVNDIIQILFALNETYYVGDGSNLKFIAKFKFVPANFEARVSEILYPGSGDAFRRQYEALCALIDEVVAITSVRR
jgi:hypothetical protein